jgi:hypothetical protein
MEMGYTHTAEDSLNWMRATPAPPWSMFLFILLLALLFLVAIYLIGHDYAVAGWAWLALSVAIGIAVYEVPRVQARRAIATNPSVQGEIVWTLDNTGCLHEIQRNGSRVLAVLHVRQERGDSETGDVPGAGSRTAEPSARPNSSAVDVPWSGLRVPHPPDMQGKASTTKGTKVHEGIQLAGWKFGIGLVLWIALVHRNIQEVHVMARIGGAEPSQQGLFSGWLTRIVYALTKRKLGRVVLPVQVTAHHPQILWGYGQMEQSLLSSHRVETALKDLATLRVATLIGCPF